MIPTDPDPDAEAGTDGLTDWERQALADQFMRECGTFTPEVVAKAHARRQGMRS